MKKYGVKIGYLVIVFFMCFNITYTSVQAVTNEDTYKERYFQLQNQYIELKNDLNNEQQKIKDEIKSKEQEIDKKVNSINNNWKILEAVFGVLGCSSIVSIIIFINKFKKFVESKINSVELKINDKVQDIVMGKTDLIVDLMRKQSEENNIIDNKRILVISKDRESKNNIDNILLKRFKYKSNILIDEFKNEELYDPLEKYDLIVFNRFTYENGKSMNNVDEDRKSVV